MNEKEQLTTEQLLFLENLTYLTSNNNMPTLVTIRDEKGEDFTVKDVTVITDRRHWQ